MDVFMEGLVSVDRSMNLEEEEVEASWLMGT